MRSIHYTLLLVHDFSGPWSQTHRDVTQLWLRSAVKPDPRVSLPNFKKNSYQSIHTFDYLLLSARSWSAGHSRRIGASPSPWSTSLGPSAWCAGRQKSPCRSFVWMRIYNEYEPCFLRGAGGYSKKSYYAKQNSTNNAALAMTDQLYRNSCYGSNVNP